MTGRVRHATQAGGVAFFLMLTAIASAQVAVSTYGSPGTARDLVIVGALAYVVDAEALRIVDLSDPLVPVEISSFAVSPPGEFFQAEVVGNLAYLAAGPEGIVIVDVADPALPTLVSSFDPDPTGQRVSKAIAAGGGFAYVGDSWQVEVIDVSIPASPTHAGTLSQPVALHLDLVAPLLYIGTPSTVEIWDVSDPAAATAVGTVINTGSSGAITVDGDHAYASQVVADVSDPSAPVRTGNLALFTSGIATAGSQLYLTREGSLPPFVVYDRSDPAAPIHRGLVGAPYCESDPGHGVDIELVGSTLYCATIGKGLRIFDVSDWTAPILLSDLSTETEVRDVEIQDGRAYLAVGRDGMRVYDVTAPASPTLLGVFDPSSAITWDLEVFGDLAYMTDGFNGLLVVDVSDPTAMSLVGSVVPGGILREIALAGDRVYGTDTFQKKIHVIDVSTPASPSVMGDLSIAPYEAIDIVAAGDTVYAAGDSALQVVDVSTPSTPLLLATFDSGIFLTNVREIAVVGDRLYAANSDGLNIFDVATPSQPDPFSVGGSPSHDDAGGVVVRGHVAHTAPELLRIQDDFQRYFGELDFAPMGWNTRAVAVSGGFAVSLTTPGGLTIIDPTVPTPPFGPCNDGIDNDADGAVDLAEDADCRDLEDVSEEPDCSDGIDNDGDGLIDAAGDPGCPNAFGQTESPECQNGLDDDGDGAIDGADPQCTQPWKREQQSGCGLGYELALVLAALARARGAAPRRAGRAGPAPGRSQATA